MSNLEIERLKAVNKYLMFDVDKEIDDITKLASFLTRKPIALISLMDKDEQIILASEGVKLTRMPRATSFCTHAIAQNEIMVVEDATKDDRFKDLPVVTGDFKVRFYASTNLVSDDGYNIGTLCVYDLKPGIITEEEIEHLKILGKQVSHVLELNKELNLSVKNNEALVKIAWTHAHEIRGPLSSILGLVDLIKINNCDLDLEYLNYLETAANQLDEVLNRIITLASKK
ncbi:GAF domain-containing protein [Pedobacter alpinus]|uniref:histidine kinase n=1 Tax=Pedobacter alpinus TaxID=1590643 RepID=A0ABW5TX54_9SPHI